MKETILVTGGAGYIGSAAVKKLISKGYDVIVVDNLSKGKRNLVDKKAIFFEVDLTNKKELATVFNQKIDYVMHFASYKAVGESMKNPEKYSDNIIGTINLLDLMVKHNVKKIIYSSTAAVYGMPEKNPITEDHPTNTINYYGYTKLTSEKIIDWYSSIHDLKYVSLRYFNIAGDFGLNYIDPEAENIFPIIMEVIFGKRDKLTIFGDDYDTRDGTCIRDYIDIHDLIDAHILALNINENQIINLGTSNGTSVKELVDAIIKVTGKDFPYEIGKKREGDPGTLIASNEKAKEILNWEPKKDIKDMIKSTFDAYNNIL
jgi:UDP-glucose 4-epimerase